MAKRAVWPLNLGYGHFAVLFITVLVVIPIVVWIALGESIRSAYLAQVVAPRLKTQYGFEVGQVRAGHGESGDVTWEAITSVAQGGVLERAGMRRGDTGCLGVDTGGITDLYAALQLLESQPEVSVSLSNAADGRQPCRTVVIRR